MESDWIRRRDFSESEGGYDPAEVDSHLRYLAEVVKNLKRDAGKANGIGDLAAAQIQPVIDAADREATALREEAEEAALGLRLNAAKKAERTLQSAQEQAEERRQTVEDSLSSVYHDRRPATEARRRAEQLSDRLDKFSDQIPIASEVLGRARDDTGELRAALETTEAEAKRLSGELVNGSKGRTGKSARLKRQGAQGRENGADEGRGVTLLH